MSMQSVITPDPTDAAALRGALSRFGTGVTIVTTKGEAGPVGITANSFSSVSLDPPLVLWSVSRGSSRYHHFAKAEHMAIHVLSSDQQPLCRAFSKSAHAFDEAAWEEGAHGVPLLTGCLARFECERYADYDGGDHVILVGRVTRAVLHEGDPLLFWGGSFGGFACGGGG